MSRRLYRVLLLIPHLTGGGAERQCQLLSAGLHASGWEVHVGYWRGEVSKLTSDVSAGIIYHYLGTRLAYDPRILYRIACLIRAFRPHVVHTWLHQMDIFGGLAALACRTAWVVAERSNADIYTSYKCQLRRFVGRYADMVIANSDAGIEYWSQTGRSPRQRVVPNGLSIDAIAHAPAMDVGTLQCPLIITVGRLISSKRPLELITALSNGLRLGHYHLAIIGDGPLSNDVHQLVKDLGIASNVTITGFIPAEAVWRWLRRAQGFIFLSDLEGQPNVVMEAMAAGCPAVVSDIPAHRVLLTEKSALFVHSRDVNAVGTAIDQIIADPVKAQERAAIAQQYIRRWSVGAMTEAYECAFLSLIKRRF